jgi:hypothetical protein
VSVCVEVFLSALHTKRIIFSFNTSTSICFSCNCKRILRTVSPNRCKQSATTLYTSKRAKRDPLSTTMTARLLAMTEGAASFCFFFKESLCREKLLSSLKIVLPRFPAIGGAVDFNQTCNMSFHIQPTQALHLSK